MRFRLTFALLAAAAVPTVAAPVAVAAPAAPAAIGRAQFDAARQAVTLPFSGPAPTLTLYSLSPTHHYYEISPARLKGGVQHQPLDGAIVRYTMANRPNGPVVRLSFVLTKPGTPTFSVDAAGRITVWPLGAASPAGTSALPPVPRPPQLPLAAAPTPKPGPKLTPKPAARVVLPRKLTPPSEANMLRTVIGRPYLDDFHHRLVMPFNGPAPDYRIKVYEKNPRWVYMDFTQSTFQLEGDRFDSYTHPLFDGWMLQERPAEKTTRLYLKFKVEAPVVAQIYPESGEIWFSATSPIADQQTPPLAPASGPVTP